MELDFGEKIAGGNAEKGASCKSQGRSDEKLAMVGKLIEAEVEQTRSDRNSEGEEGIDPMAGGLGPSAAGHESADGHCIEWLVEDDDEEGAETQQPIAMFSLSTRMQTGSEGDTIGQGMHGEAQGGAAPGKVQGTLSGWSGGMGIALFLGMMMMMAMGMGMVMIREWHRGVRAGDGI